MGSVPCWYRVSKSFRDDDQSGFSSYGDHLVEPVKAALVQRALGALVCLGSFAMDFHVLSEAVTKVVHVFRLTPIHLMILDCVEETLLSQLSLIVSRAITVTAVFSWVLCSYC